MVQQQIMTPLALLVCAVLSALSAQAKVVTDFKECEHFFYKGTEPSGMDQNAVKICQKYDNQFHFATLYSTFHRIPLYSAVVLYNNEENKEKNSGKENEKNNSPCKNKKRPKDFFIETQLLILSVKDEMDWEPSDQELQQELKNKQAFNSDYKSENKKYDRGHLLPYSYLSNCKIATCTLTNVAPMDHTFNTNYWNQVEQNLKILIQEALGFHRNGKAYIVTGTVPHKNDRIPKIEADQTQRDYERVTVPTHVWTAVCFVDYSDPVKPFSFSLGLTGKNSNEKDINIYAFPEMNSKLESLYSNTPIRVFVDNCMSRDKQNEEPNNTRPPYVTKFWQVITKISATASRHENQVCPQTNNFPKHTELRKRDVGSELVEHQYVPEKSDRASMTAADGTRCLSDKHYCKTENGFKLCCSTPCMYQENYDNYWCYSGQTIIPCSPQYSAVTINNEKCMEGHPCGRYGEDFYWCNKASGFWDYCSPPLRNSRTKNGQHCRPNHACAKYGKGYNWCYTDANNNWDYCCPHADCCSTINAGTCKSDSPCGKYGKDYLWCNTTDNDWDYCCKDCEHVD